MKRRGGGGDDGLLVSLSSEMVSFCQEASETFFLLASNYDHKLGNQSWEEFWWFMRPNDSTWVDTSKKETKPWFRWRFDKSLRFYSKQTNKQKHTNTPSCHLAKVSSPLRRLTHLGVFTSRFGFGLKWAVKVQLDWQHWYFVGSLLSLMSTILLEAFASVSFSAFFMRIWKMSTQQVRVELDKPRSIQCLAVEVV